MNIVIITGASSGIGREFAMQMDAYFESIDEFWLVARNRGKLMPLAKSLKHNARIFAMDITDREKLSDLEDAVFRHKATVRMLINCAGYGIMGEFCEQDRSLELGMIRLNCEALTELTHRMVPFMREGSRIIQMASSAAFLPQPDFAVYAATKSYVLSFSRALGEELKRDGIYVTAVCPGPVDTEFNSVANVEFALKGISAGYCAAYALEQMAKRQVVIIPTRLMQAAMLGGRFLPQSLYVKIAARQQKKKLYGRQ